MDLSSMSDSDLQAIAGQGALASISNGILGQESGHNPNIGSSIDGAIGQAQIMPGTFAQYAKPGEDINNPADNLAVHQRIIQDLSDKSGGDPARIAVGYFSGPGNIAPPDSPTPWKNDLKDGNGKSVSSYVSDVLGRINPVSSANAADSQPDLSHLSDEQLQSIAGAGQTDPSGMGAQPWSALHIQSEALPDVAPPSQLDNARNALANQNTSGLRGFLAHETAMGANAISGIPGLKETGSALAALVGAGQGDTFGQRYNNLENAQAAMRQAGQEADPAASTLAKIGGITGGLALGGKLLGAALPERAATALSAFAEAHPYYAGMAGNGALGALYGLGDGTDAESRLKGAVSNGLIDAVASVPLTYAANTVLPALIGKIAPILTEAKAPLLGGDLPLAENAAAKTVAPATAAAVANQIVPQNSEDMGKLANASYKAAEDSGATIAPQGTNKVLSAAEKAMPQTTAGQLLFGNSESTKLAEQLQALKNKPLSLAEAQEIDEGLSDAIDAQTTLGKVNKQGLKIQKIQNALRDVMHNPAQGDVAGGQAGFDALQQARTYWMQMMKMRDLERIQSNAALMDVPATSSRSGVRAILKNPNKLKFYSPSEIADLKNAAKSGIMGEALRGLGSRLTQYAATGGGLAMGGPLGGLVSGGIAHGVAGVARRAGETLQTSKLQTAIKGVAKNTIPKARK